MKTKWIIVPILALAWGCTREMENSASYIDGEFSLFATFGDSRTKTVLQQDGSVFWSPEDCINVFYGDYSGKFMSNNTTTSESAEFTGMLGAFTLDGSTEFIAAYPYSEETKWWGYCLEIPLPSEQTAVEGTFADDLFISVAKSKDYNLSFYNACGGVKFSLDRDDVKKVVFKGNGNEFLTGHVYVEFDSDGLPFVFTITKGTDSVTLTLPDGGTFKKGAWYYIVLAPQTLREGYTVELYNEDGLAETISYESPVTVRRSVWGVLKDLGGIDDSGRFIYYTSPSGQIVSPRDETGFGDATLISNKYENGIGVMEFDKPLTVIEMSTFGFCGFETVTLPEGLTDIESYAFGYCTSMKSISFPSTLRSLGYHAIRDCYSLTTVEIPENLANLSDAAFDNCTSLQAFYGKYASDDHRWLVADGVVKAFAPAGMTACSIPSYATAIGDYVFHSCSKLKTITIPDGVLTIGSGTFAGCSAMTTVTIPETVTAIGSGAFSQCFGLQAFYGKYASEDHRCLVVEGATVGFAPVGLTDYTIPSIVTNIAYSTFANCNQLKTITIPSTVTTIGEYAFSGCSSLDSITILSSTPPRLASIQVPTAIFDDTNECPIYVPAGSVETYKAATGWSRYAGRIQEIKNDTVPVPELVDLGLSVKWASCNLGANSPEENGDYYAWGETEPKEEYSWAAYKWCRGSENSLTKYCYNSDYGYNGFTDYKTGILPEDDAATVNWGKNWRMPTQEESWELANNTTISLVEYKGVTVFELKSKINGNVIYFPIAGYRDENPGLHEATYYRSYYWCSNIDSYRAYDGYNFCLSNEEYYSSGAGCIQGVYTWAHRYKGYTIRPVYDDSDTKPMISASPTSIDYGDVMVGTALGNETGRVVFTNTGDADLSISSIYCPTGFSHSPNLSFPIVIAPGDTKTITFAFKPTEVKAYSGYLQVNSNASNGVAMVKVTGNGIEEAQPVISASPTSIDYGDVMVGTALGNETGRVVFTNTGDADLSIGSIDCPTGFSHSPSLSFPIVIAPGDTKTITFAFKPTEVKAYSGYLQVNSNASNGVLKVKVTGNGVEDDSDTKPKISVSPTSLNYGDVKVGQALGNQAGRVTFTNTGGADLSISSIDCPTGFSHSSSLSFPIVITPGNTKTITFAFKPTEVKTYSGYLRVYSDALNGVAMIQVTGNGVE